MRVLDLDMDYFLDCPVCERSHDTNDRVTDEEVIKSVWSEERVRLFLEHNLGLSTTKRRQGRVVCGHNEALFFWEELIKKKKLVTPFDVVHVDSHADLGMHCLGKAHVFDELLYWPVDIRSKNIRNQYTVGEKYCDIDIGEYLLFAIAYQWVSELIYCGNPNKDSGDFPGEILAQGEIPSYKFKDIFSSTIKLQARSVGEEKSPFEEPTIPFRIIPTVKQVSFDGEYDYVLLAQSPNYTPANADYIMDIFREYIEEI